MFYIAKVDNDATAQKDERPHHFFYLTRGVTDQLAMTLDCRHLIPVFVFIFRLFKFAVERTISCHSSAVSFSESRDLLLPPCAHQSRDFIRWLMKNRRFHQRHSCVRNGDISTVEDSQWFQWKIHAAFRAGSLCG